MKKIYYAALLVGLLFSLWSCGGLEESPKAEIAENPLKVLKKGIWLPIVPKDSSSVLPLWHSTGKSDRKIFAWIVEDDTLLAISFDFLSLFENKIHLNKNKEWQLDPYNCILTVNKEKNRLLCVYYEEDREQSDTISYKYLENKTNITLDSFSQVFELFRHSSWLMGKTAKQKDTLVFGQSAYTSPFSFDEEDYYSFYAYYFDNRKATPSKYFVVYSLYYEQDNLFIQVRYANKDGAYLDKNEWYWVEYVDKNELHLLEIGRSNKKVLWKRNLNMNKDLAKHLERIKSY